MKGIVTITSKSISICHYPYPELIDGINLYADLHCTIKILLDDMLHQFRACYNSTQHITVAALKKIISIGLYMPSI